MDCVFFGQIAFLYHTLLFFLISSVWLWKPPKKNPTDEYLSLPLFYTLQSPSNTRSIINNKNHKNREMGNCLFGGLGEAEGVVQVTTSNGGIMEFYVPITVGSITNEFPGHGIFPSHDLFWKPLSQNHELVAGQSYYLLPLHSQSDHHNLLGSAAQIVREGHVRSNSIPTSLSGGVPYRMSLDYQGMMKRSYTEAFSRYNNVGFWKVKLVISPEQLLEILSQEGRTQELIESVRTVAKCGSGSGSGVGFSDQWSLSSSSRNASSKKDIIGLVDI